MNEPQSSCEITARPATRVSGSRVLKLNPETFRWTGVAETEYKDTAAHHCRVTRMALVGGQGEATAFHLRYFEIAPGGHSSLEHHEHEHAVVVMRGCGEIQLGDRVHTLSFGDTVYVAPNEVHQLRNVSKEEPFGFLCIVDAVRDRPVLVVGK
jgi:quercetin dioxygenase-like cupin family protein